MSKELKLIKMSNVEVEDIKWIWYPYIPYGKITVVQGDSRERKTTFILALNPKNAKVVVLYDG